MIFNSFQFLWLFPIIFIIYLGCGLIGKPKLRHNISNGILLLISYLLYMQWKPAFALFLFGVTAVTYSCARLIEKRYAYGCPKYIILSGVILDFLPLFVFKYYNFINDSILGFFAILKIPMAISGLNYAIPIGISFFTFQAVGYLLDVYYQRIKAEHNWWDYMLFVSFFPQIMSGPITKAASLLPQIKANRPFNYEGAVQGLKWLLWGMFLKVVLADRLGILVDTILLNYTYLSGSTCMLGAILYSFQIYSDFAGYSLIAIGVGRILGFDLINNFRRPYFAATITDFWRRWHISLTKWLTDYIYIPLGGNRCSKLRNYWNIMVTFLVSGIWHGASWTFIVWGGMHGVLQETRNVIVIY